MNLQVSNTAKMIIAAIVGFLVAGLLSYNLFYKQLIKDKLLISTPDKVVEVKLVTKIDTLRIPQNIYHTDTVKVTLIKSDTIFKDGSKEVVMIPAVKRIYRDSTKVADSVYVGYKAQVTGTLDKMDVSYSNRKSIVVIHRTDSVFTNTTITKRPGGLFLSVDGGYNQLAPGLQYIKDKNAFGVKYNVLGNQTIPAQNVQIQYSRRLF